MFRGLAKAAMPLVEPPQPAIDRTIGRFLQLGVERRLHPQAVLVERVGAVFLFERLADLFDEVGRHRRLGPLLSLQHQRPLLRLMRFLGGDVPFLRHPLQDVVAARQRAFGIDERAQARRRLDDAGDHRRLFERELFRGLVEVELRGRLDAVRAVTEIDLIGVEREDFGLRVPLLDLDRDDPFLDLALGRDLELPPPTLVLLQEDVAGELLRDRARALPLPR